MNSNRKNIRVLFVSSFTPPVNAGSGMNAYNFAKYLSEKGIEVTLLSLNRKGHLRPREKVGNLRIIRLCYFNQNLFTKILSLIIILPGYFYQVLRNDIVFVYGGNIIAFEFILLFGKLLGKKVIFRSTMFGEDDVETLVNQRLLGKFRKFTLKHLSLYFSINPAFTRSWMHIFGNHEKVFESVHGIDTNRFFPVEKEIKISLRKKLNLPVDIFIIISVGYVVERKGYRNIFKALAKLDIPFLYLVVGDYHVPNDHYFKNLNPEMKNLYNLGKSLLKEKVVFAGNKPNIDEYMKASDIFVLNSDKEGFPPNSIMESMACGLPSITRDIAGVDGFLTKRNQNIIFTSGERIEILESIKKLYLNPGFRLRIRDEASRVISEDASFEVLWNKLEKRLLFQGEK